MALHQNVPVSSALSKRWRRCSFSTPLGSTRRSLGSTFEDQLCWLCIYSRGSSVMEQSGHLTLFRISRTNWKLTSSDGPFLFLFIHLQRGRPWIGLHVTEPKKLTFYYHCYYYYYYYYYYSVWDVVQRVLAVDDIPKIMKTIALKATIWQILCDNWKTVRDRT